MERQDVSRTDSQSAVERIYRRARRHQALENLILLLPAILYGTILYGIFFLFILLFVGGGAALVVGLVFLAFDELLADRTLAVVATVTVFGGAAAFFAWKKWSGSR